MGVDIAYIRAPRKSLPPTTRPLQSSAPLILSEYDFWIAGDQGV